MDIYSTYCVIAVGGFFSGIYITLSIAKELGFWYLGTAWHFPYLTVGIAVVIRLGSHFLAGRMRFAITRDMEHEVRDMALKKIFSLPGYELKEFAPSELIQLIGEGVDQMVLYNSMYIPQLVYSIVAALTLFFVIKGISITIGLVLLISVPLIPMSIMFVAKFAKKTLKKYWMSYSVLGRGFLENLLGLTTLKLYGADSERQRIMNNQAEDFRIATMEVLSMQLNSITLMDLIAFGGAALGMILAIIFASWGSISPAGALTVILLSAEFFIPMRLLGSFFHISMNGLAAGHKLMNLLYKKSNKGLDSLDCALPLSIRSLSYSYDGKRKVLSDVDIDIDFGETIGIVGMSGSGKSTLAKFLQQELLAPVGTCFMAGCDISKVSMEALYRNVVYLGHEEYVLEGTVRDCISMGKVIEDKAMIEALTMVKMWSVFEEQDGLDTILRENGSNLSGGQKQRLALARGLLHPGALLILDEATSSIDEESETIIMDYIRSLKGSRSILIISHRMANTENCDRIYVLDEGKLIEHGDRDNLLKNNGIYSSLYREQMAYENFGKGERFENNSSEAV